MARGFGRPPIWAVIGMVVGVVTLAAGVPYAALRDPVDPLSQAELDQMTAAAAAADAQDTDSPAQILPGPSEPIPLLGDGALRVLFAGDSLTAGAFAFSEEESFRGIVTSDLEADRPVEATRIGDSGLTTAEVFPDVAGAGDDYDLVIVELGANDATKNSPQQFLDDYQQLLTAIREHSPDAALLCAGIWGADSSTVRAMDVTVQQECTAQGGGYVPLRDIYADPGTRGPAGAVRPSDGAVLDDFHPNNAGHAAIAAALLAGLAR